jgi:hypothetical protein
VANRCRLGLEVLQGVPVILGSCICSRGSSAALLPCRSETWSPPTSPINCGSRSAVPNSPSYQSRRRQWNWVFQDSLYCGRLHSGMLSGNPTLNQDPDLSPLTFGPSSRHRAQFLIGPLRKVTLKMLSSSRPPVLPTETMLLLSRSWGPSVKL